MKKILFSLVVALITLHEGYTQQMPSKSNLTSIDFSAGHPNYATSVPSIKWQAPVNEITYLNQSKEGKFQLPIQLQINSKNTLKSVSWVLRDKASNEVIRETAIPLTNNNTINIDRNLTLDDGIRVIEIIAENIDGIKSRSSKTVYVGSVNSDLGALNRKDYALVFVTDKYDNWRQLVNPVYDGRSIGQSLEKNYGFNVDVVENPSREQVFLKLREYAEKKYNPLDQLVVFFAGHGFYDETFKEGFVVPKEGVQDDPSRTSYIRHSELRSTISNNPCDHVLLVMDVCFGGTFDDEVARGEDEIYAEASKSDFVIRKLKLKTRKYITSGGKEYVSDGIAGNHSPFAKQFLAALNSQGGNDGILTLSEIMTYLEKGKTPPQHGKFTGDKLGSDFVFVVK